jgi:hypothetical protein
MVDAEANRHFSQNAMNLIRVHLGPMPRMLRDMINDLLSAEPDITIVGNSYDAQDGLPTASAQGANIMIAQERASQPGSCTAAVLSGAPGAILSVAADGRSGTSVSLIRQPICLNGGGLSLPDAVRNLIERQAGAAVRNHD